jgi:autotransporter-associated beta strand protein
MDNTPSFYNLADTSTVGTGISGYALGSGTLNATGNLNLAAWGGNRNGTMNINTTGSLNVTGTLRIGNDNGSVGVMNLESGSVILSHTGWGADETHIGHGGGVATLNIAGGSLSASRNFRLGNDRGNGTINITGGSLTVAGTDDVFIGRDKGTAVVNQSGGVVEFNHNTFIANGNNQSDPTTGTYNLSDGTLNVKREFVIGREGANGTHIGTLNMTGGTITKTGDEKMIVGHNNGTGYVLHSGGTIYVNQNELFIGNENAGALGTYTLSGTGALNVANELVVGRESGTGILNVDGGTLTTSGNGNMYVGRRNGTGTLNQTAGVISVIREFGVGTRDDNKIGTGTYNLSGGSLTVANNIFIGKEQGSSGTLNMTGGTLGTNESLRIGHNQATGVLSQSAGTVNVQNEVYVGNESNASSVGTYSLSGTGVLNVGNEVHIGRDNGTGTFNLNGGTVNATKISGGNGNATVNFNGGVLKAKRDEANLIENLDVADVQSGGLKINSNGFNVSTSQVFTGTGGLEKLGAGSLTLGSTSTYSGSTNVATGALVVNGNISTSSLTTVNSGATLSGSGTVGAAVIDGTLAVGNSPGQMIFTNTVDLNGITIMEIDGTSGAGVVGGHDFVNLTGAGAAGVLTYGGTLTLDIGTLFGVGTYSWNLFDFASETDSFATISLADQYSGSLLDGDLNGVWDLASGNNTWQFSESTGVLGLTVIPEPSAAVLCGLSMLALLRRRRNA